MAVLLQTLSARLGLVTGRDLAQACHDDYPRAVNYVLFALREIAIAACDLAEVLGGHGHRGLSDIVYGETIARVRHHLDIPIVAART